MSAPIKVAADAAARIVSLFGWAPASRAGAITGLVQLPPVGSVVGPTRGHRCGHESIKPVRQSGLLLFFTAKPRPMACTSADLLRPAGLRTT